MTYSEVKRANTTGLKLFAENKGSGVPKFKFQIKGVDFENGLCQVNGEWQDIQKLLVAILNRQLCVVNLQVLKGWGKFEKDFVYYNDEALNSQKNKVLYATAGFFTDDGVKHILKDYDHNISKMTQDEYYDIFNDYVIQDYSDLCDNMYNKRVGDVLVLMRVKTWQGVRYGYKVIKPRNWEDILGSYGCDDYAYYVDRFNLIFKGYHHDSDCTPNMGILREVKPDVELTDERLNKIIKAYEAGDASNILSRYTTSLRVPFAEVFGW